MLAQILIVVWLASGPALLIGMMFLARHNDRLDALNGYEDGGW